MIAILLYLLFSFAAIGALAFWLNRLGQSARRRFADIDEVRRAWLEEYPDAQIAEIVLSADSHGALLQLAEGDVGLVRAMGQFFVAKKCDEELLKELARTGTAIRFEFADFADPTYQMDFIDEATALSWYKRLEEHQHA